MAQDVSTGILDDTDHVCVCGNKRLTAFMNVQGGNMLGCQRCGSFFSDMVQYLRQSGTATVQQQYGDTETAAMRRFVADCLVDAGRRGIRRDLVAVVTDNPAIQASARIDPAETQDIANRTTEYGAIIVPDLTSHLIYPLQTMIGLAGILAPEGVLYLRARSASHPDLAADKMGHSSVVHPASRMFFLSEVCLETVARAASLTDLDLTPADDHWIHGSGRRDRRILDVAVMAGIGDTLWSLVLVPALLAKYRAEKLRLFVQDPGGTGSGRSNALLQRFDFVESVIAAQFPIHPSRVVDPETGYYDYLPPGPVAPKDYIATAPFSYRLVVNPFLEKGVNFQEIAWQLELEADLIDHHIFARYREEPGDAHGVEKLLAAGRGQYIVFYLSSSRMNSTDGFNRGSLWTLRDWAALGRALHNTYNSRIVITGAAYDLDYLREFTRFHEHDFHDIYINTVGQFDIIETREVLKNARFIVAYPSGIPIMGVYLGTPVAMFWRPRHLPLLAEHEKSGFDPGFATAWLPPRTQENGRYIDLWYGTDTPDSVASRIRAAGW